MKKISLIMAVVSAIAMVSCKENSNVSTGAPKVLVVVDMQNDFIDGSLGSPDAQAIVPAVVEKIRNFDGYIVATRDTHGDDYLTSTLEGSLLPVSHCTRGTHGWEICPEVTAALEGKTVLPAIDKPTFGSLELPKVIASIPGFDSSFVIELVGLDTDICVVSNALSLRMHFPDNPIEVDSACCAGTCPERHLAALETMKSCQISVK